MSIEEDQYKQEMKDAGVEIPEAEVAPEKEPAKEPEKPAKEPPADKKAEEPDKKEEDVPLKTEEPQPQRKRSIYDDYKDKKSELKTEKERADALERDNAELRSKLEAVGDADTPEEKKEATDDLEAFALKIKADPAAIREMRDLFLKGVNPTADPELAKRLANFETWQAQNSKVIDQASFETEFQASTPKLKELFPNASPEEMNEIKAKLDVLSHTKDWHDKSLPYIAFEHKEQFSSLISPKKRGMEGNNRKQDSEADSSEFDPNADYTKMSAKQREEWEAEYNKAMKSEGLMIGGNGKKII